MMRVHQNGDTHSGTKGTSHHKGLIHFPLERVFPAECTQRWLVIDLKRSIVSLLCASPEPPHVRVHCHQPFSPHGLRVLIALITFSERCPHECLLAALDVSEDLLGEFLTLSPIDPLFHAFFQKVEEYSSLLYDALTSYAREQHLRPLRRVMTEVMANVQHLGLQVRAIRMVGYQLQPKVVTITRVSRFSIPLVTSAELTSR